MQGRLEIQGPWVVDYQLRLPPGAARAHVLLHGYGQDASRFFSKLEPVLPAADAVLALNGPFPVPERTERPTRSHADAGWRVGYSWYFYDPSRDDYLIDMKVGAAFVRGSLDALGLGTMPKTLIGFSQGGYLAPFAARELAAVDRVIGIACQFLDEELPGRLGFRLDAIHGLDDETTDPSKQESSVRTLQSRGEDAHYFGIAGVGHRITPEVLARVRVLMEPDVSRPRS